MQPGSRIFVAGRGLVGSAILRRLEADAFRGSVLAAARRELDLRDQAAVNAWFQRHRPEYVFVAAGTVGGIQANTTRPAEFIYDNLLMSANILQAAYAHGATKLLYFGSSCVYPRLAEQPIAETALLTGALEPTNEAYAIAKIAGMKLCESYRRQYGCDFVSVVPTNLYGPGDNFDLTSSHVVPALIRKFHDARVDGRGDVVVWGTGAARREFMHVDDLADACVFLMDRYSDGTHINVGTGEDVTIRGLADIVRDVVYPEARIVLDATKPDGMPRKALDASRIFALGWRPRIALRDGIASTYEWFLQHRQEARLGARHR